jgi:hypothetical protein
MAWNEQFERVRARLHQRAFAYQALFVRPAPTERNSIDTAHWWQVWRKPRGGDLSPAGEVVLKDLARYCYASRPTLKVSQVTQQSDALAMAFAEGRRDVFNRIVALCNLSTDQIERIAQAKASDD